MLDKLKQIEALQRALCALVEHRQAVCKAIEVSEVVLSARLRDEGQFVRSVDPMAPAHDAVRAMWARVRELRALGFEVKGLKDLKPAEEAYQQRQLMLKAAQEAASKATQPRRRTIKPRGDNTQRVPSNPPAMRVNRDMLGQA